MLGKNYNIMYYLILHRGDRRLLSFEKMVFIYNVNDFTIIHYPGLTLGDFVL